MRRLFLLLVLGSVAPAFAQSNLIVDNEEIAITSSTNYHQVLVGVNGNGLGLLEVSGGQGTHVTSAHLEVGAGDVGIFSLAAFWENTGDTIIGNTTEGDLDLGSPGSAGYFLNHGNFVVGGSAVGFVNLTSGTLANYGNLSVGISGTGTLQTGTSTAVLNQGNLYVATNANSYGLLTINGRFGSQDLFLGQLGTAAMEVQASGHLVTRNATVAQHSDVGTQSNIIVSGVWENQQQMVIGAGGIASMIIQAGGRVESGTVQIGGTPGSFAEVDVNGQLQAVMVAIGGGHDNGGELRINSGGMVVADIVTFNGGGDWAVLTLSEGGTLVTSQVVGPENYGLVYFMGGTLRAGTHSSEFFPDMDPGKLDLSGGGLVFDTQSYNVSTAASFSGTSGLRKLGAGTLTLSGSSSYQGGTVVQEGTLRILSSSALPSGTIRVEESGILHLVGSSTLPNTVELHGGQLWKEVNGHLANAVDVTHSQDGVVTHARFAAGESGPTTLTVSMADLSIAFNDSDRTGSILSLTGLNGTVYVLELHVSSGITVDSAIGWYDGEAGVWRNAILGNHVISATDAMFHFAGSFESFKEIYGSAVLTYIGAYGYDLANGVVWAVLDHEGEFAIVRHMAIPEPGAVALWLTGLGAVLAWRRRTVKAKD